MYTSNLWMKRIRNIIGLLGMILPWFCLLGYYIIYRSQSLPLTDAFPNSMSITYYVTPVLPMILTAAAIVLITYVGYDWRDRLVTTLSGVCGLLIVLFPCSDSNGVFQAAGIDRVAGYFQTPVAVNGYTTEQPSPSLCCWPSTPSFCSPWAMTSRPPKRKNATSCTVSAPSAWCCR